MYLTDLNGKQIEITDLEAAIEQADDYRHWHHTDVAYAELDRRLQAYWQHIYEQILTLKNKP